MEIGLSRPTSAGQGEGMLHLPGRVPCRRSVLTGGAVGVRAGGGVWTGPGHVRRICRTPRGPHPSSLGGAHTTAVAACATVRTYATPTTPFVCPPKTAHGARAQGTWLDNKDRVRLPSGNLVTGTQFESMGGKAGHKKFKVRQRCSHSAGPSTQTSLRVCARGGSFVHFESFANSNFTILFATP